MYGEKYMTHGEENITLHLHPNEYNLSFHVPKEIKYTIQKRHILHYIYALMFEVFSKEKSFVRIGDKKHENP